MWLECTITYLDDDEDSPKRKRRKRVILTKSFSYTDAESKAIEWTRKETSEEFEICPIKLFSLDEVVTKGEEKVTKGKYFLIEAEYEGENQKGMFKPMIYRILIEEKDAESATQKANKYLTFLRNGTIKKVTETKIEAIL